MTQATLSIQENPQYRKDFEFLEGAIKAVTSDVWVLKTKAESDTTHLHLATMKEDI